MRRTALLLALASACAMELESTETDKFWGASERDVTGIWRGSNEHGYCLAYFSNFRPGYNQVPDYYDYKLRCQPHATSDGISASDGEWSIDESEVARIYTERFFEPTSSGGVVAQREIASYESNTLDYDRLRFVDLGVSWGEGLTLRRLDASEALQAEAYEQLVGEASDGRTFDMFGDTGRRCTVTVTRGTSEETSWGIWLPQNVTMRTNCHDFASVENWAAQIEEADGEIRLMFNSGTAGPYMLAIARAQDGDPTQTRLSRFKLGDLDRGEVYSWSR